jgi:cytochrome c-type biogenesis protein CcmF
MELGWGGYWAWDPVENASLLPWLTGTALLHSAVLMLRRGIFKRWTAALTAASFFLCIMGTYLTRSGIIQSVHSFGESPIGAFFLAFLAVIALVSVAVILARLPLLRGDRPLEDLFTREGFFLLGNVLLVLMTLVTLVGTIFPVISGWFTTAPVTVGPPFYNKVILPMGLLLAMLMSTGPILGSGIGASTRVLNKLILMGAIGLASALLVAVFGYYSIWSLFAAFTVGAVLTGVCIDVFVSVRNRPANTGFLAATFRVFTLRPRHWGAQLAHLGLAAIVAGIVGSSVYGIQQNVELRPATATTPAVTGRVGSYTLETRGFQQVRRENHMAIVGTILVTPDGKAPFELKPERRYYDKSEGQPSSEVGLHLSLATDVYITLAGWEDGGSVVTVGAIINPLVNWIWIGGTLLTLGGMICMIPSASNRPQPVEATIANETAVEAPQGQTARERRRARQLQPAITATRN